MEGEKETAEEEEEELPHHHAAASSVDFQDLPIMHWEELSERIAELEKQEQERRERDKRVPGLSRGGIWSDVWDQQEEEEDFRRCRVSVVTSRLQRNLQLCFINNSESDEEEQAADQKVTAATAHNGLKQEVVSTLRALRDQLLSEQREEQGPCSSCASGWKHLDVGDLRQRSVLQLSSLRATLQHNVHALSSELVTHLLIRDQLRTKQDAMLLDVQDLT
ncbi:schwannomin-interacting protein 1 [Salarias fasciatus]|uniref:schwannomin-interacting protein 1 n=1 Tax=Salarias fasciatus TaxID=181472 RepID=UPI0011767DEC|nr:schwannomin-interacting protein 1-like [Salarias fasciatus]